MAKRQPMVKILGQTVRKGSKKYNILKQQKKIFDQNFKGSN